jgi:hypothetical protein
MPANATVADSNSTAIQMDENDSVITFAMPSGLYLYNISPVSGFTNTDNLTGTLVVSNTNILVQIQTECPP